MIVDTVFTNNSTTYVAIGFLVLQLNYLLQALAGNRTGWKGCSELNIEA